MWVSQLLGCPVSPFALRTIAARSSCHPVFVQGNRSIRSPRKPNEKKIKTEKVVNPPYGCVARGTSSGVSLLSKRDKREQRQKDPLFIQSRFETCHISTPPSPRPRLICIKSLSQTSVCADEPFLLLFIAFMCNGAVQSGLRVSRRFPIIHANVTTTTNCRRNCGCLNDRLTCIAMRFLRLKEKKTGQARRRFPPVPRNVKQMKKKEKEKKDKTPPRNQSVASSPIDENNPFPTSLRPAMPRSLLPQTDLHP